MRRLAARLLRRLLAERAAALAALDDAAAVRDCPGHACGTARPPQ